MLKKRGKSTFPRAFPIQSSNYYFCIYAPWSYATYVKKIRSISIIVRELFIFLLKKRGKSIFPRAFPIRSPNFVCHCTTPCLYQPIKKKSKSIPITVLKFCLVQVCDIIRTHGRTHGRTDAQTNFWITIPRVGLKALELKYTNCFLKFF